MRVSPFQTAGLPPPCSICLDEKDPLNYRTDCGHLFHRRCLVEWVNYGSTCPVCRKEIEVAPTFGERVKKGMCLLATATSRAAAGALAGIITRVSLSPLIKAPFSHRGFFEAALGGTIGAGIETAIVALGQLKGRESRTMCKLVVVGVGSALTQGVALWAASESLSFQSDAAKGELAMGLVPLTVFDMAQAFLKDFQQGVVYPTKIGTSLGSLGGSVAFTIFQAMRG